MPPRGHSTRDWGFTSRACAATITSSRARTPSSSGIDGSDVLRCACPHTACLPPPSGAASPRPDRRHAMSFDEGGRSMADAQLPVKDDVKAALLRSDEEFRQLVSEHHALDEQIRQLSSLAYLS